MFREILLLFNALLHATPHKVRFVLLSESEFALCMELAWVNEQEVSAISLYFCQFGWFLKLISNKMITKKTWPSFSPPDRV